MALALSLLRRLCYFGASLIAIIAPPLQSAPVAPAQQSPPVAECKPVPKLLHYEVLSDDRESRAPHRGQVRLNFTIDRTGHVRDVQIVESTDGWFK